MISEEEIHAMRATWQKRRRITAAEQALYREEAWKRAQAIAGLLKKKYAVEVILFGSLARNDTFDQHSDLDFFLEGWCEEEKYWRMLADVERIAGFFPFHIVTEKDAPPSLLQTIREEGLKL